MRDACFRLYGILTDDRENPVEGVRVRAFDRDLGREDDALGETLTDASGRFRIHFGRSAFSRGLERRPDLYLTLEERRSGRALGTTRRRTRWRAGREEWFELRLPELPVTGLAHAGC